MVTMLRPLMVMICLVAATLACSLTADDTPEPTAQRIVLTPSPTLGTTTPTPTATTASTTNNNTVATAAPPPTIQNCTVRTDWVSYTVQSGDTLGTIATATGSTLNALAQGNCLANPDFIAAGQVLQVPQLPSTTNGNTNTNGGNSTDNNTDSGDNTNTDTGSGNSGSPGNGSNNGNANNDTTDNSTSDDAPVLSQGLVIRPTTDQGADGLITSQATIALSVGVVESANEVLYYAGVTANDTAPVNIFTDTDPFDGTQMNYTFNDFDSELYFWAVAENEFGSTETTRIKVTYDPNFDATDSGENSAVFPSPRIGYDTGTNVYTLQHGATVTLTWSDAPTNATRIDFFVDGQVIGSDTNPSNGATLSWAVPEWVLAEARARAFFPNGSTEDSLITFFYSEGEGVRPSD